ncbi:ABC transporter ATP-binding protein, partial [Candidatus Sumerlaeota bacterium]|nr:ABC transporter ATP-binding protein [Candidatus Sumerlaeota bacterium]
APQRGEIRIDGKLRRSSEETELAIRKMTVYLPDHPWLPLERTGREWVIAVGKLYGVDDLRLMDHVDRLFDLFDLTKCGDSPIRTYSNGQQKKLSVCSALATDAPVMILDEPFSGGLDPSAIYALRQVLQRLAERDDITIVMATQVPELVDGIADKILLMREGQIAAFDTIPNLRKQSGAEGSLHEILERLINPHTAEKIQKYFEGEKK